MSTTGIKKPDPAIGCDRRGLGRAVADRPAPDIGHPLLKRLFRYWSGKKAGRDLPSRQDIDPLEIGPEILPHIMLTDVLDDGRLRYRLAGTQVEAAIARSLGGHFLDELLRPPYRDYIFELYAEIIEGRHALYTESLYPMRGPQPERLTQRLMLPLISDDGPGGGGGEVVMVLSGQVFKTVPEAPHCPPFSPIPSVQQEILRLIP